MLLLFICKIFFRFVSINDCSVFLLDGKEIARLDTALLSTEVVGGFTGVTVGMYCSRGAAEFDYFDYTEIED